MSEHKNLAEALAAFQGAVPGVYKKGEAKAGSFSYKYADLADIVEVIQPHMLEHGLSFSAFPCATDDGRPALAYKLRHSSGDVEGDVMPLMLSKADAQALGSAITYGRRYALCAVLNIVADADDDGQAAKAAAEKAAAEKSKKQPAPADQEVRPAPLCSPQERAAILKRQQERNVPPTELAAIIVRASGANEDDFHWDSQSAAEKWIARAFEKGLPKAFVQPILTELDAVLI